MKSKIVCTVLLLVCGIIAVSGMVVYAAYERKGTWLSSINKDAYEFPVTPQNNKEKWASLKTSEEKEALLQIPEDRLREMSTEGLIATCLQYPNLVPLFAYNSPQRAIDRLSEEFNGLKELLGRKDVGDYLLKFYSDVDLDFLKKSDKYPAHRLLLIEYILAQPSVLETVSDKDHLVKVVYDKMMLKQDKYEDVFSTNASALVLARTVNTYYPNLMKNIDDRNGDLKNFIETGEMCITNVDAWAGTINSLAEKVDEISSK